MKNFLLLALFVAANTMFALPAAAQQRNPPPRINYHAVGAPLPQFSIRQWDGKTWASAQLTAGKGVIVMIFSPDCDHCEHAVDSLMHWEAQFKNYQLVFVCEAVHQGTLKAFVQKTGMDKTAKFTHAGTDGSNLIPRIYNNQILPQFNIYNSKHALRKSFSGNAALDSLGAFLHL